METKVKFNTEEGQIIWKSDIIEGKLDSIIVMSDDKIGFFVMSELGYEILTVSEHIGSKYYAPRATMMGTKRNLIVDDQFDEFNLNEKIEIMINGPKNKEVTLIIRID
tara:strand:- start:1523 stop:1846 length:324 start_codon:yes stop_codon:yes gene_type:complete